MAPELPVDYYLDNFTSLLQFVRTQYGDLLTPAETAYADEFAKLSMDGQRLYVRLISRRGPLFRSDKLAYPEIRDQKRAWSELSEQGYLAVGEDEDAGAVLSLLTKTDLISYLGETDQPLRSLKRDALLELAQVRLAQEPISASFDFEILRPLKLESLQIYRLLFFGNLRQDLTDFVLADLGVQTYESYEILPDSRSFDSRELIDKVLVLYELGDELDQAMAEGEAGAVASFANRVPEHGGEQLVRRRADRMLNTIGRQLEREQDYPRALAAYERADATPSRERRCRILEKTGNLGDALAIVNAIILDPRGEAENEFALRIRPRLQKKLGQQVTGGLPPLEIAEQTRNIELPYLAGIHVEARVRDHLALKGDKCFYLENHLFVGLFGLAFWDVIFMPVRGAFFNAYQTGPADLYSPSFQSARKEGIRQRLAGMSDEREWKEGIKDQYQRKLGLANPFVHWQHLTEDVLSLSLERIPVMHLAQVFRRLLRDLRNNRSGFPDLVCFPTDGSYMCTEVKGPGDRLQENQKRWLRVFQEIGVPFSVINVRWSDQS